MDSSGFNRNPSFGHLIHSLIDLFMISLSSTLLAFTHFLFIPFSLSGFSLFGLLFMVSVNPFAFSLSFIDHSSIYPYLHI